MIVYYYQMRDGSIQSTQGIDPWLSNGPNTARVMRMDGVVMKCIHDNDHQPWSYHLSPDETVFVLLSAPNLRKVDHSHDVDHDLDF